MKIFLKTLLLFTTSFLLSCLIAFIFDSVMSRLLGKSIISSNFYYTMFVFDLGFYTCYYLLNINPKESK